MTVAEMVGLKVAQLPPDRQREVLALVESLAARSGRTAGPRHDPEGLLADLPSNRTPEDFAAARREGWQNFPRGIGE